MLQKILQNVCKCIYVHIISSVYKCSIIKIYSTCNVNYKLAIELRLIYRIITLKTSKKIYIIGMFRGLLNAIV